MREIIFFKAILWVPILSVAFALKVKEIDLPYCPEGIGVYSKPNADPLNTQLYMSNLWKWPKKGKISNPCFAKTEPSSFCKGITKIFLEIGKILSQALAPPINLDQWKVLLKKNL